MRRSIISTCCGIALVLTAAFAAAEKRQGHRKGPADTTKINLTAGVNVAEIPIKVLYDHVIVPIAVNGSAPLRIVLDTGMPSPGLILFGSEATAQLGLHFEPSTRVRVGGAGGSGAKQAAQVAMSENLSLPGVEIQSIRVMVMPPFDGVPGHDGIIGWSLFERFVVEIDVVASLMRLYEPTTYKAAEIAASVPLELKNGKPYAVIRTSSENGKLYDATVLIDVGASAALSLNAKSSRHIKIPRKSIETPIGMGLSGIILGRVGRVATVELGGFALRDVVVAFPVGEHQNQEGTRGLNGNLGSEILLRFKTTFDYGNRRMLIEPNQFFEEPFGFNTTGIGLGFGSELMIVHLLPNSPASEVGLELGDVITHLNGSAVSGADRLSVREAFEGTGILRLRLRRAGQVFETELTLRKLI